MVIPKTTRCSNVRSIILKAIFLLSLHGRQPASCETAGTSAPVQCLKEIVPHADYQVLFSELHDFFLTVQINCAGFARASLFSLSIAEQSASFTQLESDLLEVPVRVYRGNLLWKYVVHREDGSVEEREFVFRALPLYEPSIAFKFPPDNFSWRRGVPFFFILQLSEPGEALEYGYPRFFFDISLTSTTDPDTVFGFTWGSNKQLSLLNHVQPSESMVVMEDFDFPPSNYTLKVRLLDGYKEYSGVETSMIVEINQTLAFLPYESDFSVAECKDVGGRIENCSIDRVGEQCEHDIRKHFFYLPKIDPLRSIHRCSSTSAFTSRVEELYKVRRWNEGSEASLGRPVPHSPAVQAIDDVVRPTDRDKCKFATRFRGDIASAFGTNIRALLLAISRSMKKKEQLVFEGNWEYLTYRCTLNNTA
eukprot:754435-Hanusia_phi.AAC.1